MLVTVPNVADLTIVTTESAFVGIPDRCSCCTAVVVVATVVVDATVVVVATVVCSRTLSFLSTLTDVSEVPSFGGKRSKLAAHPFSCPTRLSRILYVVEAQH